MGEEGSLRREGRGEKGRGGKGGRKGGREGERKKIM